MMPGVIEENEHAVWEVFKYRRSPHHSSFWGIFRRKTYMMDAIATLAMLERNFAPAVIVHCDAPPPKKSRELDGYMWNLFTRKEKRMKEKYGEDWYKDKNDAG